ncbi:PIN domain protein [Methylomonas methanica]|uniref:PIN domain protein n=1 Tax=Methylomonas methanica TaxID=421 RepID=A0A177M9J8_METMH|nr:hypothetical protein [Methylomonas methanica]OAI02214.1 PIN domain protein [Methylomonas methanica]
MLIYLDNCCFNRPYDDQSHANIFLETQAKLYIQEKILSGKYQLIWSYILQYENEQNPYIDHKHEIGKWRQQASILVTASPDIVEMAKQFQSFGLGVKDALHCACAVLVDADYFVTTDKQLLKVTRNIKGLNAVNPLTFIQEEGNS